MMQQRTYKVKAPNLVSAWGEAMKAATRDHLYPIRVSDTTAWDETGRLLPLHEWNITVTGSEISESEMRALWGDR